MKTGKSIFSELIFVVVPTILSFFIYYPALRIWAMADDFIHLAMLANIATRWQVCTPQNFVFRPIERYINSFNGYLVGYESTIITHLVAIGIFAMMVLLVYYACRRVLSISRPASSLTALFFSVLPANVMSVTQIDTISQLCASFFAILLFIHLYGVFRDENGFEPWRIALTFVLSLLALFSKETAIGIVAVLPLSVLFFLAPAPNKRGRTGLIVHWSATGVALMAYFGLRVVLGASQSGGGQYVINFSPSLIGKNIAQLLFASVYAGSTIDIYPRLQPWRIVISLMITVVIGSVILFCLFRKRTAVNSPSTNKDSIRGMWVDTKARRKILLIVLMLSGTFPICLIGKMSELYAFGLVPFYCFLVGMCLDEFIKHFDRKFNRVVGMRFKFVVSVFFLVMTVWLSFLAREKVMLTRQTSDMYQSFYHTVRQFIKEHGKEQVVICWQYSSAKEVLEPSYSSFVMPPRTALREVFSFCNDLHLSHIKYIENYQDSLPCEWYVSYQNDSLKIVRSGY